MKIEKGPTAGATNSFAGPRDIVVKGERIAPELQRTVSYRDLNFAERPGQRTLRVRIYRTATSLCLDLNGQYSHSCTSFVVRSTDNQVAQVIDRAKHQLIGLSVGPPVAIAMVIGVQ